MHRVYKKIIAKIWLDKKFQTLTEGEKLTVFYVLTSQSNRIGLFYFSPALAAEELNVSKETFAKRFGNVCETLFWQYDECAKVVFIPTWWKYNHAQNENVLKGNLKDLREVPETDLKELFLDNIKYLHEDYHSLLISKRSRNVTETLPKSIAVAVAVTEAVTVKTTSANSCANNIQNLSSQKKKNVRFNPRKIRPDFITEKDWDDLILHRKTGKGLNTERAYKGIIKELAIATETGFSVKECIDEMSNRSWKGFKAEWMLGGNKKPQKEKQPWEQ